MKKIFLILSSFLLICSVLLFDFTPQPTSFAWASTVNSSETVQKTKEAADKVKQDDRGVKQQFGQGENGKLMIDKARDKAQEKLNDIADKAESNQDLPPNEQLLLENIEGKN